MKINIFFSMVFVGFVILKIVIMVYILCGYNICVCDDKGWFVRCKLERGYI